MSLIWSEEVKSDVTMTSRSRHELTYGTEAPLMDIGVLGTVFPMQSTQLFSTEIDNCQASAH